MKTPQTDDLARGNHVVPSEWAEQLERERDEARELLKASCRGIHKTTKLNQFLISELIAVRKERDEIKGIASEFAIIASHCLGWHENKDSKKLTRTLKRWLEISSNNELDP